MPVCCIIRRAVASCAGVGSTPVDARAARREPRAEVRGAAAELDDVEAVHVAEARRPAPRGSRRRPRGSPRDPSARSAFASVCCAFVSVHSRDVRGDRVFVAHREMRLPEILARPAARPLRPGSCSSSRASARRRRDCSSCSASSTKPFSRRMRIQSPCDEVVLDARRTSRPLRCGTCPNSGRTSCS